MKKYTEKIHAKRLLKMLDEENPCGCCPAAEGFDGLSGASALSDKWGISANEICTICATFIGLKPTRGSAQGNDIAGPNHSCPCLRLGKKRAIQRTWEALEEKG